jgi:hypothetical protein
MLVRATTIRVAGTAEESSIHFHPSGLLSRRYPTNAAAVAPTNHLAFRPPTRFALSSDARSGGDSGVEVHLRYPIGGVGSRIGPHVRWLLPQ